MNERAHEGSRLRRWGIALALAAGVVAIYGQTLRFEFVAFDDDHYLTANPIVQAGLSQAGIVLAFTQSRLQEGFPYHPLTWLSHMLDVELFGGNAAGHHATNVALHALASLLLFLALRDLTGATWRSAAAAALWAWHPLRVESVAWVSERKDVLSGVFAMATLLAYARYARRESRTAWWAMLVSFTLGLLSKPTLVPLPCALLLLDYWPLARQRPFGRLVLEKLPLFALSAVSSVLTIFFHRGWMAPIDSVSFGHRAANAVVSVARYLGQFVWPSDLAPFHPHPYLPTQGGVALGGVTIAAAVLLSLGITLAVLRARRQPYLAVGWLWFLGMLTPTIGLVQVGYQALADRYTYLPNVGLSVAAVWGIAEGLRHIRHPPLRRVLAAAAAAALVAYGVAAGVQARIWRDSETLFLHTLAVNPRASLIRFQLGAVLRANGRFARAVEEYRAGLEIDPNNAEVHFDLGRALHAQGRSAEAIQEYLAAAACVPPDPRAAYQLGVTYELEGRRAEAIEQYRRAIALDPANPKPRKRLAVIASPQATP